MSDVLRDALTIHGDLLDLVEAVGNAIDLVDPVLESPDDVRKWFDLLLAEGYNFHPEDSASGLGSYDKPRVARTLDTDEPSRKWVPAFTRGQAASVDAAMARCYELVDDPCEVAVAAFAAWEERNRA